MSNIRLYNEDCLEGMKKIPGGSIDMILTDLPYGITACKWDVVIPFEPLWEQYERVIKEDGAIVLFSSQPFTTDLINSNRELFRYEIIWEKTQKTGFYNANRMPLKGHENILIFYKKLPTYNPQKYFVNRKDVGRIREKKKDRCVLYGQVSAQNYTEDGSRYPHDVIHFSNWNGALFGKTVQATKHPTQKPVPLFEYLIKTYTNEGDTVLDSCMGSGTTAIACFNTNRNCIGFELDPGYYQASLERIEQHQKQLRFI